MIDVIHLVTMQVIKLTPDDQLKVYYTMWLRGYSLRRLAKLMGVRHGTVHSRFRKVFGKDATNLKAMSLVRSLLEDYPDDEKLMQWSIQRIVKGELETVQHRSKHSMSMLSQYQTLNESELMDTIAVYEEPETEAWDFLRLPLFVRFTEVMTRSLLIALYFTTKDLEQPVAA